MKLSSMPTPVVAPTGSTAATGNTANYMNELLAGQVSRAEIRKLMATNVNWQGKVLLPEECTKDFAEVHQMLWTKLTESASSTLEEYCKFAIGLPRGHAKTQLLKFLCVYIVVETKRRFILVVCATVTKARNFVNDVITLLASDNANSIYGNWREDVMKDNDEYKKFRFNGRTVILMPMGISGSLRGANIDNTRPDVIICDDAQDRIESQSPEIARKQMQWFLGDLLKARSYKQCLVVYLGNMYPDIETIPGSGVYGCILRNLDLDPDWTSIVTGAILSNGQALWPEVHPIENLLADLAQDTRMGERATWFAEVQNSPEGAGNHHFDMSQVPAIPYVDGASFPVGKFIVIDPSRGAATSDSQEVALCYVYDERGPVVQEIRTIQKSAPDMVREVILWALEEQVPLVVAESVAYQSTLLQWFNYVCEAAGIEGIMFLGISRDGQPKNPALVSGMKQVMGGTIMMKPAPLLKYAAQATLFNPLKIKNMDDVLDVTEYCSRVFLKYQFEYQVDLLTQWSHSAPSVASAVQNFNPATYDFRQ